MGFHVVHRHDGLAVSGCNGQGVLHAHLCGSGWGSGWWVKGMGSTRVLMVCFKSQMWSGRASHPPVRVNGGVISLCVASEAFRFQPATQRTERQVLPPPTHTNKETLLIKEETRTDPLSTPASTGTGPTSQQQPKLFGHWSSPDRLFKVAKKPNSHKPLTQHSLTVTASRNTHSHSDSDSRLIIEAHQTDSSK